MTKLFGDLALEQNGKLALFDADSSNFVALKSPAVVAADVTFTLPGADGTAGQVLKTDGSGALSFVSTLTSSLTSAHIFVGDGSNLAADVAVSGDLTLSNTGNFQIAAGVIVNADINASAAIAYSKLALTGAIVNADVNASAAIAYTKLALTGSVVNADIAAAAAIAYTKLALTASIVDADIAAAAAIAYSKLALTASIVDADIAAAAAIAVNKLAAVTASKALVSDASGFVSASAVTATELGYVAGVTSAIQTQLGAKASTALDNLAAVAINASLLPASDAAIDLGSAAKAFAVAHANKMAMKSNAKTTTLAGSASASADVDYVLPVAAPAVSGYVLAATTGGVMSWVTNTSPASYKADWDQTVDPDTIALTHGLATTDVLVQVIDTATGELILVDSIVVTSASVVTLTVPSQPAAALWRVIILGL